MGNCCRLFCNKRRRMVGARAPAYGYRGYARSSLYQPEDDLESGDIDRPLILPPDEAHGTCTMTTGTVQLEEADESEDESDAQHVYMSQRSEYCESAASISSGEMTDLDVDSPSPEYDMQCHVDPSGTYSRLDDPGPIPGLYAQVQPYRSPTLVDSPQAHTQFIEEIQTFEFGELGTEFHIPEHGITVSIEEGTIAKGQTVHFEYGVTLYGSFNPSRNKRPISPILWLCPKEEVKLNKQIKVTLPHYLVDLTDEELDEYGVSFAKANHNRYTTNPDGQRVFTFEQCKGVQSFEGSRGSLLTNHCCFMCIEANNTRDVALRAGYCLSLVDYSPIPTRHVVHVCASFLLSSCSKVLDLQFPEEKGYNIASHEFQFDKPVPGQDNPCFKVPKPDGPGYLVAMEPLHGLISLTDIDFWLRGLSVDEMKFRHERKMYPPRIKMTISTNKTTDLVLKLCFQGCKSKNGMDLHLELLLPKTSTKHIKTTKSTVNKPLPILAPHDIVDLVEDEHVLSPKDLRVVRNATFSARKKWMDIGIELSIPTDSLDEIYTLNNKDPSDCHRAMLIHWLKSVDPKPSWEALVDALRQPVVGEGELAERLRNEYICM